MPKLRCSWVIGLVTLALCGCGESELTRLNTESEAAAASRFAKQAPHTFRMTACESGVNAFKNSIYALVRRDCVQCHDSGGIGPAHSVADVYKSYGRIMAYVSWSDIDNSRFVLKGGNQHCLEHPDGSCKSTFDDIRKALREWWNLGQKDCPTAGNFLTKPVAVPAPLPSGTQFASMRWPLGSLGADFAGAYVEMEIQKYSRGGYYLLRKPRLFSPKKPLHIQDIRFLVNGKYDAMASSYQMIRANVGTVSGTSKAPLLSTSSLLVAEDQATGDEISLGVEELKVIAAPACRDPEGFRNQVLPAFKARSCYRCHGGGPEALPGRLPARQTASMVGSESELCAKVLQWGNGRYAGESPLVALPVRGLLGHPRVLVNTGEVFPKWIDWLKAESAGR